MICFRHHIALAEKYNCSLWKSECYINCPTWTTDLTNGLEHHRSSIKHARCFRWSWNSPQRHSFDNVSESVWYCGIARAHCLCLILVLRVKAPFLGGLSWFSGIYTKLWSTKIGWENLISISLPQTTENMGKLVWNSFMLGIANPNVRYFVAPFPRHFQAWGPSNMGLAHPKPI